MLSDENYRFLRYVDVVKDYSKRNVLYSDERFCSIICYAGVW